MLVNHKILECLCRDAGEKRVQKATDYKKQGRVKITNVEYEDSKNFTISAIVAGTETYKTYVAIREGEVEDIT